MIAGQSGETQWVKHASLGANYTTTGAVLPFVGGSRSLRCAAATVDEMGPVSGPLIRRLLGSSPGIGKPLGPDDDRARRTT